MELFVWDVSFKATLADIKHAFADELHSPRYLRQSGQLWNFHVKLFPPKRNRGQAHGGCGKITVPEEYLGRCLLQDFGGSSRRLSIAGRKIQLKSSKDAPNPAVLEKIRREPYVPLEVEQRLAAIHESFQQNVEVHTLQLGWETRGAVFSVEWEKQFQEDCHLKFSNSRREIRIGHTDQPNIVRSIAIPWSQISWSAICDADEECSIFLSLYSPPIFDTEATFQFLIQSLLGPQIIAPLKRQRVLVLYPDDADLIRVLPYATLCIRLLCRGTEDVRAFKALCKTARLSAPRVYRYDTDHLALFSETKLEQYCRWTSTLYWPVAFQLESLLRGRVADAGEILSIRQIIDDMLDHKGADYTSSFLRSVAQAHDSPFEVQGVDEGAFADAIERYANGFTWSPSPHPWGPKDGIFNCLHVSVSPTSMALGGPYPERSNRVLRTYADNHDSFIRVSFVEETGLRYQQDREIDGPGFIGRWVSPILRNGLTIAGRQFHFLAYSQSALKTHTVWFVKNFQDREGNLITAATIIDRLGTFHDVEYDRDLIYCPARYAARISLAFTTTDSSVSVPAEEIIIKDDIKAGAYCFTDGVGSMSPQIAQKIWRAFQKRGSRSSRRAFTYSRAFQIRLGGAKGMLSVDHKLKGDVVILRPSMIKFNAPQSTDIEIAQAFVRPSKYYLNRPLIMVLEDLGIRYEVFERLQDAAVQDVNDAMISLKNAVKTLDQFGLATSYRVSSTLVHLAKLDITPPIMGDFYDRMIEITIHHILRDLKHHARIPVDEGYTLVGVADIHGYLEEGEVFACATTETGSIHYLEGDVLVSRSPIIHPGDVQVVRAIGRPPLGSPFKIEPLMNTVVFSVKGSEAFQTLLTRSFIHSSCRYPAVAIMPGWRRPRRRCVQCGIPRRPPPLAKRAPSSI